MNNIMIKQTNYYQPNELRSIMKLLSSQNTMWTRNYIVSYISNLEDVIVLENRLYVNVVDFKNIFNNYYDNQSSENFELLFRNYISNLIENLRLLKVYYNNPNLQLEDEILQAYARWNDSGVELAKFLSNINQHWNQGQLETLFLDHIEMTKDQMQQRLRKEYAYEVHQYDFIEYHSLMIADILTNGIIESFY